MDLAAADRTADSLADRLAADKLVADKLAADKDDPLREDIRFLGSILGETIRAQEGEAVFATVEEIRKTSIRFHRERDEREEKALESILADLSPRQAALVVRSFSYFSHLANIAEDAHHARRNRAHAVAGSAPHTGTIKRALANAKQHGVTRAPTCTPSSTRPSSARCSRRTRRRSAARARCCGRSSSSSCLTGTARPTSARRSATDVVQSTREAMLALWQTSLLRRRKLTVIDEVANGLSYYDYSLLRELPGVYRTLESQLQAFGPTTSRASRSPRSCEWAAGSAATATATRSSPPTCSRRPPACTASRR